VPSTSVKQVLLSHLSSPLFISLVLNAGTSCLEHTGLGHHLTHHLIRIVEATCDAFLTQKVTVLGYSVVHKEDFMPASSSRYYCRANFNSTCFTQCSALHLPPCRCKGRLAASETLCDFSLRDTM